MLENIISKADSIIINKEIFFFDHPSVLQKLPHDCFKLNKTKPHMEQMFDFFSSLSSKTYKNILELGIFKGGSIAFWNEFFQPEKIIGIDILKGIYDECFTKYINCKKNKNIIKLYLGVNQLDTHKIESICKKEFSGSLDLVIDDASHRYEETKASFETIFPFLRPNGTYIIEDWAGAYWKEYQDPKHPDFKITKLANLIHEIIIESTKPDGLIKKIIIYEGFVVVIRNSNKIAADKKFSIKSTIQKQKALQDIKIKSTSILTKIKSKILNLQRIAHKFIAKLKYSNIHSLSDKKWLKLHLLSLKYPYAYKRPLLPPQELQLEWNGSFGKEALREGFDFYKQIKAFSRPFTKHTRVLDFGCGWGRICRFFNKDIKEGNLSGIDIDPEIIKFCKNSGLKDNFYTTNPFPPTNFKDNYFDVIFSFSVFTHLPEILSLNWLKELSRILTPGGRVFITVWTEEYVEYILSQSRMVNANLPAFEKEIVRSFNASSDMRDNYRSGLHVYFSKIKTSKNEDIYGNSFMRYSYIKDKWSKHFKIIDCIITKSTQATVIMEKPRQNT